MCLQCEALRMRLYWIGFPATLERIRRHPREIGNTFRRLRAFAAAFVAEVHRAQHVTPT